MGSERQLPVAETARDLTDWYERLSETHPEMVPQPRPVRARDRWTPTLLRVYGIKPWEIGRFTIGELSALADDIAELNRG